jgi:hypothetical protein
VGLRIDDDGNVKLSANRSPTPDLLERLRAVKVEIADEVRRRPGSGRRLMPHEEAIEYYGEWATEQGAP